MPAVIDRFREYHDRWPAWGRLHIVLDDLNVTDRDVDYTLSWALKSNDQEGWELASILRAMSRTQRRKLADLA